MSALAADQAEMDVTSNNLANSSTAGYARRVSGAQEQPSYSSGLAGEIGTGVSVGSVQSIRDPMLDSQVQQETQQQSASQEIVNAMQPVQTLFVSGNGGVSDAMTTFFSDLQELSTSPADPTLRTTVLTDANNLASAFQNTASQLTATPAEPGSRGGAVGTTDQSTDGATGAGECPTDNRARLRAERQRP